MKDLMTMKQACSYLNYSKPWLYKLIKKGEITPIRLGKNLRFKPEDLEELVNKQQY